MSLGIDETKAKDIERDRKVDADYRTLRIIWLAILTGLVALFIITRVVEPSASTGGILFSVLFSFGVVNFSYSFILKYRLLKQAVEKRKPELARSGYIIAFTLCEAVGIFGLITHLVAGAPYYYFFFVLSGFGILLHKPQRDDLLAASAGRDIWEIE